MDKQSDLNTQALWNAAKQGDAEVLRTLIAKGVDVNVRDKNGWTPLHVATQYGHAEAMRTLIAARSMQSMRKHGLIKQDQAITWNETLNKHYTSSNTPSQDTQNAA